MSDEALWAIYFSQAASWRLHPGYTRPETQTPTLDECAEMADQMLIITHKRRKLWQQ